MIKVYILAPYGTMCYLCRSFAAVGVDPAVMGIGPAVAIPAAVKSAGLELDDIDLFEINEVLGSYINCKYLKKNRLQRLNPYFPLSAVTWLQL